MLLRIAFLGRRLAVFLSVLALLSGCDRAEPPLVEVPIGRKVAVSDVLAAAQRGPDASTESAALGKARAEHLVASGVEVPEDGVLFVDARMSRRSGGPGDNAAGPALFHLEVEGERIYTGRLTVAGQHATLEEQVPLAKWAGQAVEIGLRYENRDPERAIAYWGALRLERLLSTSRRPASAGRNLLFVVVDTLRADHMSLYGYARATTPFLDELAESSLVFDRALAPATWTFPSVASLLTGLTPPRHGAVGGGKLPFALETLAETAQAAGLTTVGISANPIIGHNGFDQGFEEMHHIPWTRAEEVNTVFREWRRGKGGVQWLAFLQYIDPHDPYDAPEPAGSTWVDPGYDGLFRREKALNELFFTTSFGQPAAHAYDAEDLAYLRDAYDGEILYWDQQLRALVEELRAEGVLERTSIVLVSDHGEELAEHGMFKHGHQVYDETARVPLLIHAPGVAPGRRAEPVEARRLHRAALQLLRLAPAPEVGDLLGPPPDEPSPVFVHTTYPVSPEDARNRQPRVAIELEGWKLMHDSHEGWSRLYALEEDPMEASDLAARQPERAARYQELLEAWLASEEAASGEAPKEVDADALDALRELGYIQ